MLAGPASWPWRRYIRVRLRGLLALTMVMWRWVGGCIPCEFSVRRSPQSAGQAARSSTIEDGRSRVFLRGENHGRQAGSRSSLESTTSLTSRLPRSTRPRPHAMLRDRIGSLTRLERLRLSGSSVSDAGLSHLKGLATLPELDLSSTQVSDAGLVYLKALGSLEAARLTRNAGLRRRAGSPEGAWKPQRSLRPRYTSHRRRRERP